MTCPRSQRVTTLYSGGAAGRSTITPATTLTAANVRRARVDLVGASVPPTNGPLYWAFIHPDVAYDLRSETGAAAWRDPWDDFAQELASESLVAA